MTGHPFRRTAARLLLAFIVGAMAVQSGTAFASCSRRPGTPNNLVATAISSSKVKLTWNNTTFRGDDNFETDMNPWQHDTWFDIWVRDGNGNNIGLDVTGGARQRADYGTTGGYEVDNLAPKTNYCFTVRARDAANANGCISAVNSNWSCTSTPMSGREKNAIRQRIRMHRGF